MKKELIVYILIFVISFALTSGMLFFLTKSQKKTSQSKADSLKTVAKKEVVQPKAVETKKDTTAQKATTTAKKNTDNLSQQEKDFLRLIDQIKKLHGMKDEEPKEKDQQKEYWEKVDSTITVLKKQIENQQKEQKTLSDKVKTYEKTVKDKDALIKNQQAKISELEKKNTDLHKEKEQITNAKKEEESSENLKSLAKIYNNMDPKKAAEFIQRMPIEKGIGILKNLNQKKAAKIMSAMRADNAARYSQKMSE